MKEDYAAIMATPIPGVRLGIRVLANVLSGVDFLDEHRGDKPAANSVARHVVEQINRYFDHAHKDFDFALAPQGTQFQKRVWRSLQSLPVAATFSYGEIAGQLGSSARAVGGACRANPIPIVVPCHRVVAATGVGGYMGQRNGASVDIKQWLLHHESKSRS